jgi:hypothetical protein
LWNSRPTVAYVGDRSRLWDWSDLQFFRGGHVMLADLYPPAPIPALVPEQFCRY